MRLRTLGAVCATCVVAVPMSSAVAQSPGAPTSVSVEKAAANAPGDLRRGAKHQLINKNMYLSKRLARVTDDKLTRRERQRRRAALRHHTMPELRRSTRRVATKIRRERAKRDHGGAPDVPIPGALRSIAACESNGNARAISAGGRYRGKYQFSFSTWRSVGGKGDPAAASETEQDRRAAILYRTGGPGHWPVCGR